MLKAGITENYRDFINDAVAFEALPVGEKGLARALYYAQEYFGTSTPTFTYAHDYLEIEEYSKALRDHGIIAINIADDSSGLMRMLTQWARFGWTPTCISETPDKYGTMRGIITFTWLKRISETYSAGRLVKEGRV